jgi:AraC-like DNA-binding protein
MHIKHMVSLRCKLLVQEELKKLDIAFDEVKLGEVDLSRGIKVNQKNALTKALAAIGLEVIEDRREILVESIKLLIIEMLYHDDGNTKVPLSIYLSNKLDYDYTYLANTFSESEGISIAHFCVLHKIERIKELIQYDELSLTQISYELKYSSLAALSNQFKKVTGITPSVFKASKEKELSNIDRI